MTCDRPDVQMDRPDVENIRLEDCQIMVVESEKNFKISKIFIEIPEGIKYKTVLPVKEIF